MKGGYCINWSAWRVWFHPRRAFRALRKGEEMEIDYQKRLEEALALIEAQKMECARLTNKVSDLARRCLETEASLLETKRLLEDARRELKEQEVRDKELAEIEQTLSGFEEVKRNYERKIRNLESLLRDAKIKSRRADDEELLIDMTGSSSNHWGIFANIIPPENKEPRGPSLTHREQKEKTSTESINSAKSGPLSTDSDDWLLSLPDTL